MHLTQGVHRAVQLRPDGVATIHGERRRTWRELTDRVARLAAILISMGVSRGDRVAVIALNSDRFIELYYAVWWAGGVIVPCNTRWALHEQIYAVQDSGAETLLLDATFAPSAQAIAEQCAIRSIFYLDDGAAPNGMLDMEALMSQVSPVSDRCGQNDELAVLFYTGGTTGRSKGVMLSHANVLSGAMCLSATAWRGYEPKYLHSPPMFHIGDAGIMICITLMAGTHVVIPSFTTERFVRAVEAERVDTIHLIPTMFSMLREYLEARPADLSSVRSVSYGAAPVTETLLAQAMDMFPNAEFVGGFGLTEAYVGTLLTMPFHRRSPGGKSYLRSVGRAVVGVDLKIVNEELNDLPHDVPGEILLRSPAVMLGYWKQPELTQAALVDGWVRSGDIGYMDEEGFVYLVDRKKDMIVSGGENVYSSEVENAISSHASVLECAVIGIPDERWGERVHAIVRPRPNVEVSADDLILHCQTQIARYKAPRSVTFRVDPFPLSGAGKVLKTELRKPYLTEREMPEDAGNT